MSEARKIRVLVVDDSAFARKVVRTILSSAGDIEVVGIARDGLDAIERCAELKPDVITLDLVMPDLDGLGVLRAFAEMPNAPRVLLVSTSAADSDIGVEALQLGAVDLVQKPTATATDRMYELEEELIAKVRVAALSAVHARDSSGSHRASEVQVASGRAKVIVLGTSTGGPQALTKLFGALPASLQAPMAVVLHIPPGYTRTLAERLNRSSALTILEAEQGLEIGPGMAVIARAGIHLHLTRSGESSARCELEPLPANSLHRPSVDELFTSAARAFGEGVLGVILTGMGDDGLRGSRAIHTVNGRILTEHPDSCVVYGMPSVVKEAGLSTAEAHLDCMAEVIVKYS